LRTDSPDEIIFRARSLEDLSPTLRVSLVYDDPGRSHCLERLRDLMRLQMPG
jgi:hypothetical protein